MKISKLVVVCVLVAFIFMCALSCVVGSKSRDSEINSLKEELAVAEKEAVDALLKHVECLEGRLAKGGVLPVAEEEDVVDGVCYWGDCYCEYYFYICTKCQTT